MLISVCFHICILYMRVMTGGIEFWIAGAGIDLIQKAEAQVMGCACVIELPELKGRAKLGDIPLYVIVEKEDMAK